MKTRIISPYISAHHSHIIDMAWSDHTSFDAIYRQTGLTEKQVINIMRAYLKPQSFNVWHQRVSGRKAKHEKIKACISRA